MYVCVRVSRSEQTHMCKPENTLIWTVSLRQPEHLRTASINISPSGGKAVLLKCPSVSRFWRLLIYWTAVSICSMLVASEVMKCHMCNQTHEELLNINNMQTLKQCKDGVWRFLTFVRCVCHCLACGIFFWPENCCWSSFLSQCLVMF